MRFFPAPFPDLSLPLLAVYALFGRTEALQALFFSWFLTMLNPGLAPPPSTAQFGRYLVLFAAVASVGMRSVSLQAGIHFRPLTLGTCLLGGFFVVHSLFVSPMVEVSALKAVSWTLAMAATLAAWSGLDSGARDKLIGQIFAGLTALMLLSLPLLGSPLGYLRNAHGFQGVFNQPQVFGTTMALLGAWAAARLLGSRHPSWMNVAIAAGCAMLVVLSEARTGGLAMVLGIAAGVVSILVLRRRGVHALLPGLASPRLLFTGGSLIVVILLSGPFIADQMEKFVLKRSEATSLTEAYDRSRGALIEPMTANIQEHPIRGIGFGIASNPHGMRVTRDPILGLPVGASVEKGVMPLAVWEELGVAGLFAVSLWLLWLIWRSIKAGIVAAVVSLTALSINMGEAVLFSPGGFGLLLLILLGWTATARQTPRPMGEKTP